MSAAREHLIDGAKASPIAAYAFGHWFMGVNWPVIGSFLMAVYTLMLIMDKAGLLAPLKAFCAKVSAGLVARVLPRPRPAVRTPQDE